MTDRTVKVSLVAQVSGYVAGMDQAARKTRETAEAADLLAKKGEAIQTLGRTSLVAGAAIAAGVAVAIRKFAEFDQAMSNVNAVTQETTENMALLRDAALEAGGRTIFTATEAAHAIEELGKAGLSTADILNGALDGALDLAASGQLEVADAAEITATTLKQYGLAGTDAAKVADVLSAGAGKALGSVQDLSEGLKYVGPVAHSMGVSLEETTGVLALFADQGIIGEQAGTSLRGMLSSLTSPSSLAAKEIERLGINLYDADGKFKGVENAAGELSRAYTGLDDKSRDASLGIIFGNAQVTSARVLYQGGADAVHKYTAEVQDSGYAARVANDRLNNLAGDVEKLGGAFDTALIKGGSGANDVLRGMVESATFLVDAFGALPQPLLDVGLAVGSVAGAIALAGGVALLSVPKIIAFKGALDFMGISGKTAALRVVGIGSAMAAAGLLIAYVTGKLADQAAQQQELADTLDASTGAITDYTRATIAKQLQEAKAFDFAGKAGITQKELTAAVLEGGDALAAVSQKMHDYANFGALAAGQNPFEATEAAQSVDRLSKDLDENKDAWTNQAAATDDATQASEANADALTVLQGSAEGAGQEITDLADIIRGFGSATLTTRDAQRQFQAAVDDASQSVKDNGKTLDINTEAGRANQAALDDIAKSALDAAGAVLEQTGSQEDATVAVQSGRDALILQLAQFGIVGQAAEEYADSLGLIPSDVKTAVVLDTSEATKYLNSWIQTASGKKVLIEVGGAASVYSARGYALGGPTPSGSKFQVAGVVHAGEYVSTQETLAKPANRAALDYMHAGGDMSSYAAPRYASPSSGGWGGGSVTTSSQSIELNVHGSEPAVVAELVMQQAGARLRSRL